MSVRLEMPRISSTMMPISIERSPSRLALRPLLSILASSRSIPSITLWTCSSPRRASSRARSQARAASSAFCEMRSILSERASTVVAVRATASDWSAAPEATRSLSSSSEAASRWMAIAVCRIWSSTAGSPPPARAWGPSPRGDEPVPWIETQNILAVHSERSSSFRSPGPESELALLGRRPHRSRRDPSRHGRPADRHRQGNEVRRRPVEHSPCRQGRGEAARTAAREEAGQGPLRSRGRAGAPGSPLPPPARSRRPARSNVDARSWLSPEQVSRRFATRTSISGRIAMRPAAADSRIWRY